MGADRLAAILSKAANEGRELNIWRQFGHMTMDVVGSAAFGCALTFCCAWALIYETTVQVEGLPSLLMTGLDDAIGDPNMPLEPTLQSLHVHIARVYITAGSSRQSSAHTDHCQI